MRMSGWRPAIALGLIPIVVGVVYWFFNYSAERTTDAAGAVMLVALGLAMGFGTLVLVRGARDL